MNLLGKLFIFAAVLFIYKPQAVFADNGDIYIFDGVEQRRKSAFEIHEESFRKPQQVEAEKTKQIRFRNYSKFRSRFNAFCSLLYQDRQVDWLLERSKEYSKSIMDCLPCRGLYISLTSSCRAARPLRPLSTPTPAAADSPADEDDESEAEEDKLEQELKNEQDNDENFDEADDGDELDEEDEEDEEASDNNEVKEKEVFKKMDPGTELLDLVSDFFREMAEAKPREVAEGYYVGVEHLIREMRLKEGKSRIEQEYFDTLAEFIEAPFKSRGFLPEKKGLPLATPPPSRTPKVSIDDLF